MPELMKLKDFTILREHYLEYKLHREAKRYVL